MTLLLVDGRLERAMAEEFENYEARLAEAHRAVERWEAEGGAQEIEIPAKRAPGAVLDSEQTIPSGQPGEVTHEGGEATEG